MDHGERQTDPLPSAADTPFALPPGTPDWITPELVELTLKVWQKYYEERLSTQTAVTILENTGRLFTALSREESHEKVRRPGTGQLA